MPLTMVEQLFESTKQCTPHLLRLGDITGKKAFTYDEQKRTSITIMRSDVCRPSEHAPHRPENSARIYGYGILLFTCTAIASNKTDKEEGVSLRCHPNTTSI